MKVKLLVCGNHFFCPKNQSRAGKQIYISLIGMHDVRKIRPFCYLQAHPAFSHNLTYPSFGVRPGSATHDAFVGTGPHTSVPIRVSWKRGRNRVPGIRKDNFKNMKGKWSAGVALAIDTLDQESQFGIGRGLCVSGRRNDFSIDSRTLWQGAIVDDPGFERFGLKLLTYLRVRDIHAELQRNIEVAGCRMLHILCVG